MKSWKKTPSNIKNEKTAIYYDLLKKKIFYRFLKRSFDIFVSFFLFFLLLPISLIVLIIVSCSSRGGPFFLQERIGRYNKKFKIIKFRTMYKNTEGSQHITHNNDARVTPIGSFLRKSHIDEFPQLINVFLGQMSFVGTRPEVEQFISKYKDEWKATLLMRPGITSTASISYDNESIFIEEGDADSIYLNKILPLKMEKNLFDIKKSNVFHDLKIMIRTVFRSKKKGVKNDGKI